MFLWILLLAHVIGDFPLQTDAIFRLKTKYPWGVLPHVLICTAMNILVLIPYLSSRYAWYAIAFLGVVHTVLDRTKISVSDKIAKDNFLQFIVDQLLHVLSIALTALWLSHIIDVSEFHISGLAANRELIIQLTALIFAAFGGVPIIFYARKYVASKNNAAAAAAYPTFLKRIPGFFERFLSTLSIIWGGWWLPLAIGVFLPRLFVNWKDEDKAHLIVNVVIGFATSLVCGLLVLLMT